MLRMQAAQIVATPEALQDFIHSLNQEPAFALDTESNSLHAYYERVCLIQVSTASQDFIIDPLALTDLSPLAPLMANKGIQKVLHAGDYDIACLKRDFGFEFANLFDTMLAATTLGETNLGLAALLESRFGLKLEKKFQRADWGKRPLMPAMLAYAQTDSRYLLALRDLLIPDLIATGRFETFKEDCAALALVPAAASTHELRLCHVKGAQALKPKQLGLLRELQIMRENLAKKHDKPPFKILGDRALVELAVNQPRYMEELQLLPSLTQRLVRRYGRIVLQTIAAWRSKPYSLKLPHPPRRDDERCNRREKLANWRKEAGKQEGLPSHVILPKDLLDTITARPLSSHADLKSRMAISPSRYQRYGQEIYQLLTKETS